MDNRKSNLRICDYKNNLRNSSKTTNNTSGVTGVGYRKDINKWRAYIIYNYKHIALGCYEHKDDAIKIRLIAENKYFGDFAPQKHLFEQFNIV